jgi:hypothetical protein
MLWQEQLLRNRDYFAGSGEDHVRSDGHLRDAKKEMLVG